MSNEAHLLRMLEPAVRPGGLPGPVRPQQQPIESRDFDSLLEEARGMNTETLPEPGEVNEPSADRVSALPRQDPMGHLAGVDRIENSSLHHLLKGRALTTDSGYQQGSQTTDL